MKLSDALTEAKKRWGERSTVLRESLAEHGKECTVLAPLGKSSWTAMGIGDSWEAAFADADQKEAAK